MTVLASLVNAATVLFVPESMSRKRPISIPRSLPSRRMAFNLRFSAPRNETCGIKATALSGSSERSSVSIELISATVRGRTR